MEVASTGLILLGIRFSKWINSGYTREVKSQA